MCVWSVYECIVKCDMYVCRVCKSVYVGVQECMYIWVCKCVCGCVHVYVSVGVGV